MKISPRLLEKLRKVRLIAIDVDGVLTDGRLYFGPRGEIMKIFHISDGLGIDLAQAVGLPLAFISGRDSLPLRRRARELKIPHVITGCQDKSIALRQLAEELQCTHEEILYIGDDINDLLGFLESGVRIAVANAVPDLKRQADGVTDNPGGQGAVREVIEAVLKAQGRWEEAISAYLQKLSRHRPPPRKPESETKTKAQE